MNTTTLPPPPPPPPPAPSTPPKRENLLINLVCNIGLPFFILAKLSAPERLGPHLALVIALAFPLGYGAMDYMRRRTANFVSIIGVVGTLATGIFGLMKLDPIWFAVKEAAVPTIVALAVLASMKSRRPLIRQFLYNDQVINVPKVEAALASRNNQGAFNQLLRKASYLVFLSFLVSAVLNYFLARWIITSTSGTPEFNGQLAKMNLLSWPVIALPSTAMLIVALWQLLRGITRLTDMPLEEIFHPQPEKKKKNA
ncbi:VC0807 family protein [Geminisphaera colitermitum]|uniref:VC0807 family protein n=1 Tax=Geminisphaera colitermitum TaxID=1148786 RepID=UPI0006950240|nr:VC0807 family protein [Geminisphaera colitermitum]